MAEYRVPEFGYDQRLQAAIQMLNPERSWGVVTRLSELYGVSRTLLYATRDRVTAAISEALAPYESGRPCRDQTLTVDKPFIRRVIATLPLLKGTVRDIQLGLDLMFGVSRSVGYISQTLASVGEQAKALNAGISIPLAVLGEADEIFQGRKPCLTVVDGRSFLVLNLTAEDFRDATTWGCVYLDLEARGIRFHDIGCDGGTGLRAGVKEAELAVPLRPDLFHLQQDGYKLIRRLESMAFHAIDTAERARRAELERQGILRRRGPRLKVSVTLPEAEAEEAKAIETYDNCRWLLNEIRQVLDPVTPDYRLNVTAQARSVVETAVELLESFECKQVCGFARSLRQKIDELLSPLEWLEQSLSPVLTGVDEENTRFILWCWQNRHALRFDPKNDAPAQLRTLTLAAWDILELFHRSSSLAESLHSWLRPYLQIHRGMPKWLLPILQAFWNHHRFQRGARAGQSPLQLAGVPEANSVAEMIEQLVRPMHCEQPTG